MSERTETVKRPQERQHGPMGPGMGAPSEKASNFAESGKRLAGLLRPELALVVLVVVVGAGSVALSVVGPKILGNATTVIFEGFLAGGVDFDRLHGILLWVVIIYIGSAILGLLQGFILNGVTQRTVFRLRESVEQKIHRLPLSYFDRHQRGDLLSRVTNDIDNISQTLQQTLSQVFISVLTVIGILGMMFSISWELALVALVSIPLTAVVVAQIAKRSQPKFVAQWKHTGELNSQIEEGYTGHALVKVFGRQRESRAEFARKNEELYEASFGAQFISGIIMPSAMFIGNLVYVAIAVIGGLRVASGTMTLGDVQAFIQYSRQFQQPISQLGSMANLLQSGVASAERVFELLDADEQGPDPDPAQSPDDDHGRLVFEDVAFRYVEDKPLIDGLDLTVEPGRTVAIVGPTGAGKTTLVNLIMRFYELNAGRITLDGTDIAQMTREDLRARTGMVLQDTWLFGGTIRDNIAYGRTGATEEEILAAAKAAYVDRFVHSLPDGYDTALDDDATNISAGERQLITIARAFVAQPQVLILDEATSSVDTRTELLVQRAMAELRKDRTAFVIAHRLSTIRDADLILVMENGGIVEQGNHAQLLRAKGAYARLYEAQFAAPIDEVEPPLDPVDPATGEIATVFDAPGVVPHSDSPRHAGEDLDDPDVERG
ncbi:ABC transporter ATP-binding protein [Demequina sp. SYSU T00039]|uniref:Fatty acid ABC transporter ATP-binding/permease protein n=1 Tax=Demequina lignilytica TaxID=3051663 RepID=A0AAW7M9B5_9MICO|nr:MULTISPECIES: ABC transporter ATP-binding protein [unclassified Demequina]MDN4479134.1 ABC transporter ATP-binding protein [Demequina sp. SYSU T00039-1]MDN4489153.1 ABC transporter ATP-binding protein [Demequina sp. SYSU T00039]MDN4490256.1 ABC transporter ATP-binding protein [Demequina sp. SYSU T00068]